MQSTPYGFRPLRKTALALVAAACSAFLLAAVPERASATYVFGLFCPPTVGLTVSLGPYPARCVGVYHTTYTGISFNNALTNVMKCAVIKPNRDGSGGNVAPDPAACAPRMEPALATWWPPVRGYAVGINRSSNFHTGFFGQIVYWS